jgi:SPOR domain
MSNPALRAPSINLDEFERRLRATGSLGGAQEDPLAELSRLLGIEEPGAEHSDAEERSASPAAIAAPSLGSGEDTPLVAPSDAEGAYAEGALATAPAAPTTSLPPPAGKRPLAPQDIDAAGWRSRGAVWTIALLLVIGAAGAAGAWFYHIGVPGLETKLPPLIMAAEGPAKVQPPSQETVSSPNDVTSLLAKDQQAKGAPVNVVSNAEQPVDLAAQSKAQAGAEPQSNGPPANGPSIAAAPLVVVAQSSSSGTTPVGSSSAAASSNPPTATTAAAPPSANQVSAASPNDANAAAGAPVAAASSAAPEPPTPFPQPKRVKTVSVRPDGSLIASATPTDDSAPTASAQIPVEASKPSASPPTNAADAEQATPKLDLPAKPSAKSTARVPINKLDTTAATASGQSPEGPLQISPTVQRDSASKKNNAGTHVADAANPSPPTVLPQDSTAAQPPAKAPAPAAGQPKTAHLAAPASADAQTNAPAAEGGKSDYAVQLAAPGSEAEAQSASTRLKAKFAAELGGAEPVIRKADLQGRTVYRVRVVGLAKSDAVSLCEKLKASGGACFIARE